MTQLETTLLKILAGMLNDPETRDHHIGQATLWHIANLPRDEFDAVMDALPKRPAGG